MPIAPAAEDAAHESPHLTVSLPDGPLRESIGVFSSPVTFVPWEMDTVAPLPRIDLVVMPSAHDAGILARLEGVQTRLVQSQSIGYDGVSIPAGTIFANAASVHEAATAELAVALALASQRQLPRFVREALAGQVRPAVTRTLADSAVLLIGAGGVGSAIHRRLQPFETSVTRVARRAREDAHGRVHAIGELAELLPTADIVILSLPLSPETEGLVDDEFLSRMRDGALLINVGRGPTVHTPALLAHVARGRIRAALDVTDPEPLPVGHPLLAHPDVIVTPHVGGGSTTAALPRMAALIRRQIEAMMAGEPPLNVVSRG